MSYISSGSINSHLAVFGEAGGVTGNFTYMWRYRVPGFPSVGSIAAICTNAAITNYVFVALGTTGLVNIQDSAAHSSAGVAQLVAGANYHFAIVHVQGVSSTLYINGEQIGQITGISFTMDESSLGLGGLTPDVAWRADDVKSWTRALSQAEVRAEMAVLANASSTSLWDWWHLNSGGANFSFVNGQVNGASRQLKVQGDNFTSDTDDLPIPTGFTELGSRRNRPGRGPYSKGIYARPRMDAITSASAQQRVVVAAGGLALAGSASKSSLRAVISAGGVVFAGASPNARGFQLAGAGGLAIAGSALRSAARTLTPAGGIVFGGSAPESSSGTQHLSVTASGGLTLAGAALKARVAAPGASGGLVFGGTSPESSHEAVRTVVAAGGLQFGGAASESTFGGLASGGDIIRKRRSAVR